VLTPKVRRTNLIKDQTGFKVGGYARSTAFGTRVYKVLAVNKTEKDVKTLTPGLIGYSIRYETHHVEELTLVKIGETNKGKFKFTNGRPFTTDNSKLYAKYYPAKGI
jgi:hypothetical protein